MRNIFISTLILLSFFCICYAESIPSCSQLKDGDLLVYKVFREDQDLSIGGELVKIKDPYENGFLDVAHLTKRVIEHFPTKREEERQFNRPLAIGMKWDQIGERDDNAYCYYVEKKEDITVPAGTFKNCFKIVYETCPDDETWWYYPGTGVVKYEYHHHGTITNIIRELETIRRK